MGERGRRCRINKGKAIKGRGDKRKINKRKINKRKINKRDLRRLNAVRRQAVFLAWRKTPMAVQRRRRRQAFWIFLALVSAAAFGMGSGRRGAWLSGQLPHLKAVRERRSGQRSPGPRLRKRGITLFLEENQVSLFQVEEEYERESD